MNVAEFVDVVDQWVLVLDVAPRTVAAYRRDVLRLVFERELDVVVGLKVFGDAVVNVSLLPVASRRRIVGSWFRFARWLDGSDRELSRAVFVSASEVLVAAAPLSLRWLDVVELSRLVDVDMDVVPMSRRGVLWGSRDRGLVAMLAGCGLSTSELVLLRRQDVDLSLGVVATAGRVVPVPRLVGGVLTEWFTGYEKVLRRPMSRRERLFVRASGGGLSQQSLGRVLARVGASAGVVGVSPSLLRRSFAVDVVSRGWSPRQVADVLGVASTSTVEHLFRLKPARVAEARISLALEPVVCHVL